MTAGGPPPVTVIHDRDDHPAWTAAAHTAHDPALGRLTVDPSPANGAPAAHAHNLLHALGKRLPQGQRNLRNMGRLPAPRLERRRRLDPHPPHRPAQTALTSTNTSQTFSPYRYPQQAPPPQHTIHNPSSHP